MFYTNLKGAWRNLLTNPFSSAINILGLATGITCCMFISLYVWGEFQANAFHENKDHIFRAQMLSPDNGRAGNSTPYPFGTSLQNEFPDIKKIARLRQDNVSVRAGQDSYFYEQGFFWADSTFFQVFGFPLLKGDAATALKDPLSIVITESMAVKYFKDTDPIGKTVEVKIYDGDRKHCHGNRCSTGSAAHINHTVQFPGTYACCHAVVPAIRELLEPELGADSMRWLTMCSVCRPWSDRQRRSLYVARGRFQQDRPRAAAAQQRMEVYSMPRG